MDTFESLQIEYEAAKVSRDWRKMADLARRAQPGLEEPQPKVKTKNKKTWKH